MSANAADELATGFLKPPPSARPWVYWFPLDGNISSNGITADLEAMARVGIGGVLYMETEQGTPRGPAAFGGPLWRNLFKHICAEAARLGLEVNMNNDAGWCGSGGPWITPELSMQRVVWAETNLTGPASFDGLLPQPRAVMNFYRDIAVFAYPAPASNQPLPRLRGKSVQAREVTPLQANFPAWPAEAVTPRSSIIELTGRLGADGRLKWDVPAGRWTVLRMGHTTTGQNNHPAPIAGRGLECDKLSKEGAEAAFNGLMGRLIADNRLRAGEGRTLVATHIDSWEVGSQNWTPKFKEEFRRLRGYDPTPFLPVMTGRVVESLEVSERFLWDVRMTVNDLLVENYAGHFRTLARRHGLRLSIEAYDAPCDDMTYGGRADEPMGEFWSWGKYGAAFSCTEMTSAAHVYGKRIIGAEAFTATDGERWLGHPGNIKDLGDWAFCEGINRFVFHRYALQPWTQPDRPPGISMGPWGLHYERTQTWWEQSRAWHEYLARCQFMLRQGLFSADLCFLTPENSPQRFSSPVKHGFDRPGYNFDGCTPEVVLTRMKTKDGRLVLPDGMSYRWLVLPRTLVMTPQLLRKIKELVADGATIVGTPPLKSPSLAGYPQCDQEVRRLAEELWGTEPAPEQITSRRYGKGRIFWGGEFRPLEVQAGELANPLSSAQWIWRAEGNPAASAPPGKRFFRRALVLETPAAIASAKLILTADNSFECWVNGRRAGSGDNFSHAYTMNVASMLKRGTNWITVAAVNATDAPNPAGLIGALVVKYSDGRSQVITTDSNWESAATQPPGWPLATAKSELWQPVRVLGPLGMEPWGHIEPAAPATDPTPDIQILCRMLAAEGVPPDFASVVPASTQGLRYIHRIAGNTDIYFVANPNPQYIAAECSFRVTGKRPEFWEPDTGRMSFCAAYEFANGSTRLPLTLGPYGSVFVVFREKADTAGSRLASISFNGDGIWDASAPLKNEAATDNNARLTNRFTMAGWVRPAAATILLQETNGGVSGVSAMRNDAIYPPPGHEVYGDDAHAGCGIAAGTNGISVFEHSADYFAPVLVYPAELTNWTLVTVVYRDGQPSLYLNGQLVRQGLKSRFIVHPGPDVKHGRQVAPFKGVAGPFSVWDRALSDSEISNLMATLPRPARPIAPPPFELSRCAKGGVRALFWEPGTLEWKTAKGGSGRLACQTVLPPVEIDGPWEVAFAQGWGAPEKATFQKLISWSEHPDAGIKYFSGAATYHKVFQLPATHIGASRRWFLDLGKVEVVAEVKLNGRDLGILWKAPFRVEVTGAVRPGENELSIKVVNLWINRMIGDELLPEDSERNPNGTLKSWPAWLLEGKPSPTGRYTFTSWRLWKKDSPLQESGLLGPVRLMAGEELFLNQ